MQTVAEQFAHVLLFIQLSGMPEAPAHAQARRRVSRMPTRIGSILIANCGWKDDVIGITAVKHWVEQWRLRLPSVLACRVRVTENH
jgi:hypothetical protein